jgi:hypothetical protein
VLRLHIGSSTHFPFFWSSRMFLIAVNINAFARSTSPFD